MQISLSKPEVARFIDEQVRAGHFPSPEAVVEAGLARLMLDPPLHPDEATRAAIEEADAQIAAGQYREWKEVSAELRREFLGK